MTVLLQLENIKKTFGGQGFFRRTGAARAVDGVSLTVHRGETLGLVGESGCGKSTLAHLMVRLEQPDSGRILLDGIDIAFLREKELRPLRPRIQIVFQDPYSSLDPRFTAQRILEEPMRAGSRWSREEREERSRNMLRQVGLTPEHLRRYPHEFSGGQRQRLAIARALITEPDLLILDEPTSALDVSVQAQVLNLLLVLQAEMGLTYLFISHNLAVVRYIAARTAVMHRGRLVEAGGTAAVLDKPLHPYTQELIRSVPAIGKPLPASEAAEGKMLLPREASEGCLYAGRCPLAAERCRREAPVLEEKMPGHEVSCWKR